QRLAEMSFGRGGDDPGMQRVRAAGRVRRHEADRLVGKVVGLGSRGAGQRAGRGECSDRRPGGRCEAKHKVAQDVVSPVTVDWVYGRTVRQTRNAMKPAKRTTSVSAPGRVTKMSRLPFDITSDWRSDRSRPGASSSPMIRGGMGIEILRIT